MDETHAEANQTQSASILPKNYTFFGSYDHSLDPKGRIIIPTAYRKPLGEVFTISITRDGEGIACIPTRCSVNFWRNSTASISANQPYKSIRLIWPR